MSLLPKRATVYFDPQIHKILKLKAVELSKSISELVNDAIRNELSKDEADLRAFETRVCEPTVSYEAMLKELKKDGKI